MKITDAGEDAEPADTADEEAGDTEPGSPDLCADVECGEEMVCFQGSCVAIAGEGYGCASPEELGELEAKEYEIVVASADGQPNSLRTSCANTDASAEAVFSFTVPSPAHVKFTASGTPQNLAIELREEECQDPAEDEETILFCAGRSGESAYLNPGTTYFLIVEARDDVLLESFMLNLEVTELVCAPPLSWRCEDDQRVQCQGGGTKEEPYDCPAGCSDGYCQGSSCANPLVIADPHTVLTGHLKTFDRNINLQDSPSCSSSGTVGPRTPGAELFLSLPGLRKDQNLRIDVTKSDNRPVIGIMSSCMEAEIQCLAADSTDGILEWPVPEDGDYFVILDPLNRSSNPFEYEIEIVE